MDRFAHDRPLPPERTLAAALLALLCAASCGGAATGPPDIVLDRSACDACGMLISAPEYAAAYRAGRRTAVFDDIGCLLRGLDQAGLATAADPSAAPAPEAAEVWFLDSDQRWIAADDAVFVQSPQLETPMGGRVRATTGGVVIDGFAQLRSGASTDTRRKGGRDDSSG